METLNLRVLFRAHEGPDARQKRQEMPTINRGYSVDFTWDSEEDAKAVEKDDIKIVVGEDDSTSSEDKGKEGNDGEKKPEQDKEPMLVTVFSAPNYPQFKSSSASARGDTQGAFAKVSFSGDENIKVNVDFTSYQSAPHPTGIKYSSLKD